MAIIELQSGRKRRLRRTIPPHFINVQIAFTCRDHDPTLGFLYEPRHTYRLLPLTTVLRESTFTARRLDQINDRGEGSAFVFEECQRFTHTATSWLRVTMRQFS